MKKLIMLYFLVGCNGILNAQVNLFPAYNQNFGTTDVTGAWTNNTTFVGWYSNLAAISHQNVTAAAPSNTGALYSYECSGDNNQKLGSRSSGGTGTIRYGVRLVNNTAATIDFLRISFDAFQFSLADDCGLQTITCSYLIAPTANNINAGGFTNIPALNFDALQTNGGTCGGTQLNGFPCTQTTNLTTCLAVNLAAGQEIMIKWEDIDNSGNDHHMGIDNVNVTAYSNSIFDPSNTCISPLPVELNYFELSCNNQRVIAQWQTASEINNSHFILQGSTNAVDYTNIEIIDGKGNSNVVNNYLSTIPIFNEYKYFRLLQVDFDGTITYYSPQTIECNTLENKLNAWYTNNYLKIKYPLGLSNGRLCVYDLNGKTILLEELNNPSYQEFYLPVNNGIYTVLVYDDESMKHYNAKVLVVR